MFYVIQKGTRRTIFYIFPPRKELSQSPIDVSRELHQNQKLVRSQAKLHVTHTAGRLYGLRAVC